MRFIAAVLLLLAPASAGAAPLADQPYTIAYQDRLITAVMINGQGPFEFVVDTGSSRTVLYEHTRARLGLQPISTEKITVYTLSGVTSAAPYHLQELKLSEERIADLTAVVVADPKRAGDEPDGILGIDVLERYFVVFERGTSRFKLYPRKGPVPEPYSGWRPVRIEPRRIADLTVDFWFLTAYFEHNISTALLDLGAGLTIINWHLAQDMRIWQYRFPSAPDEMRDVVGGRSPVVRVQGVTVDVGGRRWTNQLVLIADARIFDLLGMSSRSSSIVGAGLLARESFALDFEGRRLLLGPR
ncbi:MAG: retroviral-like aspartic protease family protein [Alphaproteobacteria bacterium]